MSNKQQIIVLLEQTSKNGKPLDFSFKNIHNLKHIEPRQGKRKAVIIENDETYEIKEVSILIKIKNLTELKNKQSQKQEDDKQQTENPDEIVEVKEEQKDENEQLQRVEKGPEIIRSFQVQQTNNQQINNPQEQKNTKNSQVTTLYQHSIKVNEETKQTSQKAVVKVNMICTTLVLSYNQIRSLEGNNFYQTINQVMLNIKNLAWIDLAHNYLTKINYNFQDFPNLKTLYLHANYIANISVRTQFQELLNIKLPNLKQFTIHGNPLEAIPHFRLMIIFMFPNLKRLDTVVVSKKEIDNANFLVKGSHNFKFPEVLNPVIPPEPVNDKDNRHKH